MSSEKSFIVMQAYGSPGILHECVFALLTICQHHSSKQLEHVEFWIYTDSPEFFHRFKDCWLNINFRVLDKKTIERWRGEIDFVHRVKIEVLKDLTEKRMGNVLYMDTDVYCAHSLSEILSRISYGDVYMHIMESTIFNSKNRYYQKLSRLLRETEIGGGHNPEFLNNMRMWNAGVLGFHTDYRPLLDHVIALTDNLYPKISRHFIEQFAFSLYFEQTNRLFPAHTSIFHYWSFKEFRQVIESFLKHFDGCPWNELVQFSKFIQLPDYLQQKLDFYNNSGFLVKIRKRFWRLQLPDWDDAQFLKDKL